MLDTKTAKKLIETKSLVDGAVISLQQARHTLEQLTEGEVKGGLATEAKNAGHIMSTSDGQVIEGVFDGQNMAGPDGKKYSVPANYASKSKLVEGDGLKLTITKDGSFVYKQINPLERDRATGILTIDEESGDYKVLANGKGYRVLSASITYFKGEPGNSVTILVPKGRETAWAAVENVFKIEEPDSAGASLGGSTEIEPVNSALEAPAPKPEIKSEFKLKDQPPVETKFKSDEPAATSNLSQPDKLKPAVSADSLNEFLEPEPTANIEPKPVNAYQPMSTVKPEQIEPPAEEPVLGQPSLIANKPKPAGPAQDIFAVMDKKPDSASNIKRPEIKDMPKDSGDHFLGDNQNKVDEQGLEEI